MNTTSIPDAPAYIAELVKLHPDLANVNQIALSTSLARLSPTNAEFTQTIFPMCSECFPWVTGFAGDPKINGKWSGLPVANGIIPWFIKPNCNNYFSISIFSKGANDKPRRVASQFFACYLIVLDDIGTKVSFEKIALLPSYRIETSPSNYQYGYIFSVPCYDAGLVNRLINALIGKGLSDPGMKDITRYARLPVGVNGKDAYVKALGRPFVVNCHEWHPDRRYTIDEIVSGFFLDLDPPPAVATRLALPINGAADNYVFAELKRRGLYKQPGASPGKHDITCPWVNEHTDQADSGTGYIEPCAEYPAGGFNCFHGHCAGRTLKDLKAFLGVSDNSDVSDYFPVVPFPFEVFPEKLRELLFRICKSIQIDPHIVFSAALTIVSAAIGNTIRVAPNDSWEVPVFLWFVVIAESGYGKSQLSILTKYIEKMEACAAKKYSEAHAQYLFDLAAYKKQKTPAGLPPVEPKRVKFYTSDFTTEALADIFSDNARGLLVYRDEFKGVISGMDQYKGGKGNDRQKMLELFDAKPWPVDRKSIKRFIQATGAAMLGGIQPKVAKVTFNAESFDDGMAPRFLMLQAENKPRKFNSKGAGSLQLWEQLLEWCHAIPMNLTETGMITPVVLRIEENALAQWESLYDELEATKETFTGIARVFPPKLETYSLKFIGIVHVMECFEKGYEPDKLPTEISNTPVDAAIKLTRYFAGQTMKNIDFFSNKNEIKNERQERLLIILESLKSEVKNGKLPIARIRKEYNQGQPPEMQIPAKGQTLSNMFKKLELETVESTGGFWFLLWEDEKINLLLRENSH